jgi:hypothetical protein
MLKDKKNIQQDYCCMVLSLVEIDITTTIVLHHQQRRGN